MRLRTFALVLLSCLAGAALAGVAQARETIELSGTWEMMSARPGAPPADNDPAWALTSIPSVRALPSTGPRALWYRAHFVRPLSWSGSHVVFRAAGLKYSYTIYLNGAEIGRGSGGFDPVECDITKQAIPGKKNDLLVCVGEPLTTPAPAAKAEVRQASTAAPAKAEGKSISAPALRPTKAVVPLGTSPEEVGIWDRAWVEKRPRVYLSDVAVVPSLRTHTLQVAVTVKSESDYQEPVTVTARVPVSGAPSFTPVDLTLAPHEEHTVTLREQWAAPELWWPARPRLYELSVGVRSGWYSEATVVRFGFREVDVQGDRLLLNGVPIRLLTVTAPRVRYDADPKIVFAALKANGVTAVRLEGQPWPEAWYDAADKAGLLIIADSALAGPAARYEVTSPKLWEAASMHVDAMARHLRNHPSIVVWNLATGMTSEGTPVEMNGARPEGKVVEALRRADSTRPVMFAEAGNPGGKADIISLYRPQEPIRWWAWPETAIWYNAPTAGHGSVPWAWWHQKPLAVEKHLEFTPTGAATASLLYGEAPAGQFARVGTLTEAQVRAWQVLAARAAGVSIIAAGDVDEVLGADRPMAQALRQALQPLMVLDLSESAQVFAGTVVTRRLMVLNDSLAPRRLELRWRLTPSAGGWEVTGHMPMEIASGTSEPVTVAMALPSLTAEAEATYSLELWEGGQCIFHEARPWRVAARGSLSGTIPGAPKVVALYDPAGLTAAILSEAGIRALPFDPANPQAALRRTSVLVIGEGALGATVGPVDTAAEALQSFVRDGGTLLVFAQARLVPLGLPVTLAEDAASVAFVRDAEHPALRGLADEDLAHWLPEGLISRWQIVKPAWGGFRTLVDGGGPGGLAMAGVGEVPFGKGKAIFCQLEVVSRYGLDPSATRLARNLLAYSSQPGAPQQTLTLLADDKAAGAVAATGARAQRLTGDPSQLDLGEAKVLLVSNLEQLRGHEPQMRAFVARGGRVVLHNVTPANVDVAAALLGSEVKVSENDRGALHLTDCTGPACGMSNEDIAWFMPADTGVSLSPRVASYCVDLPTAGGVVCHTDPGALYSIPSGQGMWVIDQVRWDDPGDQQLKADRYLAALLQSVGVTFALPTAP